MSAVPESTPVGGYHGRIGHVDLTTGRTWYDLHDATWYRRYGGGGALAAWYLLREIPIGVDALGPDNVLVFASSIVGGVDAPALSKHAVLAKSPLTGGAGESQSASTFGPAFKRAGFDAVVIHGAAASPCSLVLRDGAISIRDASSLWGSDTADAHAALLAAEGPSAHTALIGPAGENLVRFAAIVNDLHFMNQRTGMGAVMGSKRLKAVVAIPGPEVPFGDRTTAEAAITFFWQHRRDCLFNELQEDIGLQHWLADTPEEEGQLWPLVSRNFQRQAFSGVRNVTGTRLERDYKVRDEAPPANLEYRRRYLVPSGEFATDPRYGGNESESIAALAPMTWTDNAEAVLKATEMTYRFGLDPQSLGGTIAWVMECAERGILTPEDLDGRSVSFGDGRALVDLTESIAHRRGVGDLLAEGSMRAAAKIGRGSERYSMTCKGKELPIHEPRNKPGLALAWATGPIGPDYCAIEHDWDYSPAVTPTSGYAIDQSRAYGMLERNLEKDIGPLKVRQVVYLQRWWSGALESLLFDLYGVAPMRFMPPTRVEQLIRGITGWDFSLLELMLIGDRRVTLLQEFNRRHGLTRLDDTLPERIFSEPIVEGPYTGWVLDPEEFDRAISMYYSMNNWDEAGWPTPAKLYDLELQWVLDSRP